MKGDGWIRKRQSSARKRRRTVYDANRRSRNASRVERKHVGVSSEDIEEWTEADDAARQVVGSIPLEREKRTREDADRRLPPLPSMPPLDRVPLRPGHVLEISGPSGSGKTELLIQGIVLMIDLDGRFDMLRLKAVLDAHIDDAHLRGSKNKAPEHMDEQKNAVALASLRRFYRMRCSSSFEFLCALKTFDNNKLIEEHAGKEVQLVLIDGIGAFYWLDWVASCAAGSSINRRSLGVQRYSELIVGELRRLRTSRLFPILATKSLLYTPTRNYSSGVRRVEYREYMPAAWKNFVTHRILLQEPLPDTDPRVFVAQWDKPFLSERELFVIEDAGIRRYEEYPNHNALVLAV